jgi:hypothetical protein
MRARTVATILVMSSVASAGPVLSAFDSQVVAQLHAMDVMEIAAGQRAQTSGARAYGAMLIRDHTVFEVKLTRFAHRHDLELGAIDPKPPSGDMAAVHDQELLTIDASLPVIADPELVAILRTLKPSIQAHADAARKLPK